MAAGTRPPMKMLLLETDSIFALSVEDPLHNDLLALFRKTRTDKIQLGVPNTALWEFNVVLLSHGKNPTDTVNALVLVKAELSNLNILEVPTGIEDLILANKLRTEFQQLTYFDSLHIAAARRLGVPLVSSDKICQQLFDNVVSFDDFLKSQK